MISIFFIRLFTWRKKVFLSIYNSNRLGYHYSNDLPYIFFPNDYAEITIWLYMVIITIHRTIMQYVTFELLNSIWVRQMALLNLNWLCRTYLSRDILHSY